MRLLFFFLQTMQMWMQLIVEENQAFIRHVAMVPWILSNYLSTMELILIFEIRSSSFKLFSDLKTEEWGQSTHHRMCQWKCRCRKYASRYRSWNRGQQQGCFSSSFWWLQGVCVALNYSCRFENLNLISRMISLGAPFNPSCVLLFLTIFIDT